MKRSGLLLSLLLSLAVLPGCDGQSSTPSKAQEKKEQTSGQRQWPPAPNGTITLAKDPLAENIYYLLDNSGSMKERACGGTASRFEVAKPAIKKSIASLPHSVNVGLAVFDGRSARTVVPLGAGEKNRKDLSSVIDQLIPDQGTPLNGALKFVYERMVEQAQRQLGYGTYRIVIVTDGESGDSDPGPLAKQIASTTPVELYTIGFCVGKHSLNLEGYTRYYTADSPESLVRGLAAVQAETPKFDVSQFK